MGLVEVVYTRELCNIRSAYLDKTFNLVWGAVAMFLMFLVSFQCFWLLFFDNNLFMDSWGKGDL